MTSFDESLEAAAIAVGKVIPETNILAIAQLSAAISLKRIADRMEKVTTLDDDGSTGQVNVFAEGNINTASY